MSGAAARVAFAALMLALLPACGKKPRTENSGKPDAPQTTEAATPGQETVTKTEDAIATWYDVPPDSLAARRAGSDELTAANDRLPKGTRVRVTNKKNNRSVIVRITDDGVHEKGVIDLCKEAAEKIGFVEKGRAPVRLEVLK